MKRPFPTRAYAWRLTRLERRGMSRLPPDYQINYVNYIAYFFAPAKLGGSSRSNLVRTCVGFYAQKRTGLLVIHEVLGKQTGRNIPMTEAALTVALQSYHRQPLQISKVLVSDTALFGDLI